MPNKSALQHNKFLVLTHKGQPVAVWTGSTNITLGAIYGHSNVGHLVRSREVAAQFDRYWRNLKDGLPTPALRAVHENEPPVAATVPAPPGATFVPSPPAGTRRFAVVRRPLRQRHGLRTHHRRVRPQPRLP